ncbi:MAG: hypothetical protein MHM6MM_002347 [Cercozoa sp. M6MM]
MGSFKQPLMVVPGTAQAGRHGPIRRHVQSQQKLVDSEDPEYREYQTIYHAFESTVRKFTNRPCLGTQDENGEYKFLRYSDVARQASSFGSALCHLGLDRQDRVGIYCVNRAEFVIAEMGMYAFDLASVPLYDTLGKDAASYIIGQAKLEIVVASADKLETLAALLTGGQTQLKKIIVLPLQSWEKVDSEKTQQWHAAVMQHRSLFDENLAVHWHDFLKVGSRHRMAHRPPTGKSVCTVCYTSGTTGTPKGAMLTHRGVMSAALATRVAAKVTSDDVYMSYLPLAHVFERVIVTAGLVHGACAGFFRGDVALLMDDLARLRPTLFVGVPRLYNKVYDKVMAQMQSSNWAVRTLFERAYATKLYYLRSSGALSHALWDRVVFSKIAAKLGGRVRLLLTGAAPIASHVQEFLRIAFSAPLIEGYGQTESHALISATPIDEPNACGHIGVPFCSTEVALFDVPEMNYTQNDTVDGVHIERGEICFRGPTAFAGYLDMPEKTADTIDEDGWVHTGDIGMWDPVLSLLAEDEGKLRGTLCCACAEERRCTSHHRSQEEHLQAGSGRIRGT